MHLRAYISAGCRLLVALFLLSTVGQVSAQTVDTVVATNLFEPYGVAVDDLNNYYIADGAHNRIARFNPNTGTLTNLAGFQGPTGAGAIDGTGEFARFFSPQGLVAVKDGLIVADSGNHLIRKVSFSGQVTTLAGSLSGAQNDPSSNSGLVDGIGASARFNAPSALAYDGKGYIYIADTLNNVIRKLNLTNLQVTTICDKTSFVRPAGVAVDDQGQIYVADTGNHSIKRFKEGGEVILVAGSGSRFLSGFVNSPVGTSARFSSPRGLLWAGAKTELLVADTGNHVVRRISNLSSSPLVAVVDTFGNTDTAGMAAPVGLAKDTSASILITDLENDNVRIVRVSQVNQPPVTPPAIGTVILTNFCGTILTPVTNATFNNEVIIAMRPEAGTETFYTFGATENFDSIPDPTRSDNQPPPYSDCSDVLPTNLVDLLSPRPPRLTIKAYSTQSDRRPSAVVVAQFTFQAGNPIMIGNTPSALRLETVTKDAEIWYTTGDSEANTPDPTNKAPAIRYNAGSPLAIRSTGNVTVKARAFKDKYVPSSIVKRNFLTNDVSDSDVGTIGVPRDFVAGVGSTIVVPIEVNVSPTEAIQSLQFRAEVSPLGNLETPTIRSLAISTNDFIAVNFGGSGAGSGSVLINVLPYTENKVNGLGFAFIGTNSAFRLTANNTVAMLAVQIPTNAVTGDRYLLSVVNASATRDGVQSPAALSTLESKVITITNVSYVVGDTGVATGYNSSEFGDGDLKNNDVNNAFFASLGFRVPYRFSDLFDAMDVWPEDTTDVVGGDGQIRFLDWQVLLRRSLRLTGNNWSRVWTSNGVRAASRTTIDPQDATSAGPLTRQSTSTSSNQVVWHKPALIGALTVQNIPQTAPAEVPVYVKTDPGVAISGMQFVAYVVAEGDTPAINQNVTFIPAEGIPAPSIAGNTVPGLGNLPNAVYCAWNIGAFQTGLSGSNLLGRIHFNVPALAVTNARYTVYFENADGSSAQKPNGGFDQYDFESLRASVWVNSVATKPAEQLPDEWKRFFFSSLTDANAQVAADPDNDGANNLTEYRDGTDPAKSNFRFVIRASDWKAQLAQKQFVVSWLAASGLKYTLQSSVSPVGTNWMTIAGPLTGTGTVLNYTNNNPPPRTQFYRLQQVAP